VNTMGVGLITDPQHAEEIIESGQADLVALARALLYNRAGRGTRRATGCDR